MGASEEPKVNPKPPSNTSPKTSPNKSDEVNGTLALAKSFKLVLTTVSQFSNKESEYLYGLAMKCAEKAKRVG